MITFWVGSFLVTLTLEMILVAAVLVIAFIAWLLMTVSTWYIQANCKHTSTWQHGLNLEVRCRNCDMLIPHEYEVPKKKD